MVNETETTETETTEVTETAETKAEKVPALPKRKEIQAMEEFTSTVFANFTELTPAEQALFMAHANEEMRYNGVMSSRELAKDEENQVAEGDHVFIRSGNVKYIGNNGVITKVRRVRVFVRPEGSDKSIYLFRSDIAPIGTLSDIEDVDDDQDIAVNG